MQNYLKLTKKTPETLTNLIDTIKHHLSSLKNLGDPVTSNTIIIGLFLSKLNQDTIQQWKQQRNTSVHSFIRLPGNKANCTITTFIATQTRRAPEPYYPLWQGDLRGHAFTAAHSPSTCPVCQGSRNVGLRHLQDKISQRTSKSSRKHTCAPIA